MQEEAGGIEFDLQVRGAAFGIWHFNSQISPEGQQSFGHTDFSDHRRSTRWPVGAIEEAQKLPEIFGTNRAFLPTGRKAVEEAVAQELSLLLGVIVGKRLCQGGASWCIVLWRPNTSKPPPQTAWITAWNPGIASRSDFRGCICRGEGWKCDLEGISEACARCA